LLGLLFVLLLLEGDLLLIDIEEFKELGDGPIGLFGLQNLLNLVGQSAPGGALHTGQPLHPSQEL
jgi:hypothetical protein